MKKLSLKKILLEIENDVGFSKFRSPVGRKRLNYDEDRLSPKFFEKILEEIKNHQNLVVPVERALRATIKDGSYDPTRDLKKISDHWREKLHPILEEYFSSKLANSAGPFRKTLRDKYKLLVGRHNWLEEAMENNDLDSALEQLRNIVKTVERIGSPYESLGTEYHLALKLQTDGNDYIHDLRTQVHGLDKLQDRKPKPVKFDRAGESQPSMVSALSKKKPKIKDW